MRLPNTINGQNFRQLAANKFVRAGPKKAFRSKQAAPAQASPTAPTQLKQDPITPASTNGTGSGRQDLEVDSVLAKELHDNGEDPHPCHVA